MNQRQLTPLLLSATLFLAAHGAQAADESSATPAPAPSNGPRHAEMGQKFDLNKDGQIDESERPAMRAQGREARQPGRPAWGARRGPDQGPRHGLRRMEDPAFRRGYVMGKFDANGDGKLDDTERAAVKAAAEQRMRAGMERQLQRLRAVDTDNDGKISDAEWSVAKEKRQAKKAAKAAERAADDDVPPPPPPGPGGSDDDDDDSGL